MVAVRGRHLIGCIGLLLMGCAGPSIAPDSLRVALPEAAPPASGIVETEPHRLRPGDTLSIKFIHNSELNLDAPIRPDGTVSLPLIGEQAVAGFTLTELRSALSRHYLRFVATTGYGEAVKEGDELQIRFVYNPELNQTLNIRSDGRISMPWIGDIPVAGLRPAELRELLIRRYQTQLKNPDVAVLTGANVTRRLFVEESFILVGLSKPADQFVFVGGEVTTPRGVKLEGHVTALQAIIQAGGVKESGDLAHVVVLRRGLFEQGEWIQTNLANPLSGKSIQNDLALRHGDVVVVPRSDIAKKGLWVKQYIRDILPFTPNVGAYIPIRSN